MSFPPQRFFSLSSSTRDANAPSSQAAASATTSAAATFLEPNSLDLLVRAASGGGGGGDNHVSVTRGGVPSGNIADTANTNGNPSANTNTNRNAPAAAAMNNPPSGAPGGTPVNNFAVNASPNNGGAPAATVDNGLQQALLQSMQQQQQQAAQHQHQHQAAAQHHPGALFGAAAPQPSPGGTNGQGVSGGVAGELSLNAAAAPGSAVSQLQLFNMTQGGQVGQAAATHSAFSPPAPQAPIGGAPASQAPAPPTQAPAGQPPAQAPGAAGQVGATHLGQAQQQGNNMISQLVASLQAQQQAQQQAQVQAALARAFGPGANAMGSLNVAGMAGVGAAGQAATAEVARAQGGLGGNNGLAGLQGLTQNNNNLAAAQPQATRDLLSRMQLAQSVQQQHEQQQRQQQQQQATANNANGLNFDPDKTAESQASSNLASGGRATADDLLQLQLEQERHNRMLQMVQADRQERAMMANQDAEMKRQRRELKKSGGAPGGNGGAGTPASVDAGDVAATNAAGNANFQVSNMFGQFGNAGVAAELLANANLANANLANVNLANTNLANANLANANLANTNLANAGALAGAAGLGAGLNQLGVASKLPPGMIGLNQGLANALGQGLQGGLAQGLQTGLGQGLPNVLGQGLQNGLLGAMAGDPAEQHLHQKLSAGTRGAAIVPCRARGMPVDHNFKTAYFVIPEGIEHGDELMCSYPACRQAGVKFRYCLHCKVPVAKRNFRNRHRHGVPGGGPDSEESDEEGEGADAVCAPCPPRGDDAEEGDDDYAGVEREHLIIIPGAEPVAAAQSQPMKKKKKKSGHVRVPCRARGMPMAHNFKTAYFIIPPNIEHGDELLCSFPSCRSAGAKFRYCLHCKVPVAKRNFRNRHKHGNLGFPEKGEKKEGEKKGDGAGKLKTEEGTRALPSEPGQSGLVKEEQGAVVPARPAASDADRKPPAAPAGVGHRISVNSTHDAARVQRWVQLLEEKPPSGDKQAMAVWMLSLMNATEGGRDGNAGGATASALSPAGGGGAAPPPLGASAPAARQFGGAPALEAAVALSGPPYGEGVAGFGDAPGQQGERERDEEDDGSLSQPPKKKFKQEYEEV